MNQLPGSDGAQGASIGVFWGQNKAYLPVTKTIDSPPKPLPTPTSPNKLRGLLFERLHSDTITPVLSQASSPGEDYFHILKALTAAIRAKLLEVVRELQLSAATSSAERVLPGISNAAAPTFESQQLRKSAKPLGYTGVKQNHVVPSSDTLQYPFDRTPYAKSLEKEKRKTTVEQRIMSNNFADSMSKSVPVIGGASAFSSNSGMRQSLQTRLANAHTTDRRVAVKNVLRGQGRKVDIYAKIEETEDNGPLLLEQKRARCEYLMELLEDEIKREIGRQAEIREEANRRVKMAPSSIGMPGVDFVLTFSKEAPRTSHLQNLAKEHEAKSKSHRKALARFEDAKNTLSAPVVERNKKGITAAEALALKQFEVAKERAESMDLIMRLLEDFRMVSVTASALYLEETIKEVEKKFEELEAIRLNRLKSLRRAQREEDEEEYYSDD